MARYHGKLRTNSGVWVLMAEPRCFFFPCVFVSRVFSDGLSANSLESNHSPIKREACEERSEIPFDRHPHVMTFGALVATG